MDWTLEVVVLPVSDIDRSIAFYRDQIGFHVDRDTHNEHMHERSSASRIRIGTRGRCRRSR
ncbi:MAG TPA: VOC family protein, partial [Solirubrobacteraceae bacterium]|nr:VOC family protein [Solirubrobacteraceae bacterium]